MKLKKELRVFDVFSIAVGAMISSGIFILPGLAYAQTGPGIFLSYMIAGILAGSGVLCVAELATAMPKAGGDYFYISRSLGTAVGTISGLLSWFALALKSAFAVFGIAELLHLLLPLPLPMLGMATTLVFVVLNLVGVKEAGRLQTVLVVILLIISGIFVIGGFRHVEVPRFDPFVPFGANAIVIGVGFVFVAYGGVLHVASISEEVENPKRALPLGLISSIVVVTIMYTVMLIVTVGVLPGEALSGSLTPIADAARISLGGAGYWAVVAASAMAFVTTANAGIMASSRYPLALSRDGLLPGFLSYVHPRAHTPMAAVLLTGAVIAVALLLPLEILVKAASTVVITSFILANLSVIILRESHLQNYRPSFRAPLYPWGQFAAIVGLTLVVFDMGYQALLICFGFVVVGFLAYLFYGRRQADREYALLALAERILDRRFTDHSLESELRDIVYERDEITKDNFDRLVEHCPVIDLPAGLPAEEAFEAISKVMAESLPVSAAKLNDMIVRREAESSTAISLFVAIPHLIVEHEDVFQLALVRSRSGVRFSEENPSIHAIFVLAGSMDRRNEHLRCLSAIAQVVQNPEFEKKWLHARGEKALRDAVLLAKRIRH